MDTPSPIRTISDTAMWTAAYRADESDKPDAMFRDPYARRLAGERGFAIVAAIKQPAIRYGVVLRTAAIDLVVREAIVMLRCDTVLNLAAGLDTRAWRLDLPATLRWIDVDLPELLDYKDTVMAGERPRCIHEQVRLDLADLPARAALLDRVAAGSQRALVLTEGLLSYLEPAAVAGLAEDLAAKPWFVAWVTELTGSHVVSHVRNAGDDVRPDDAKARFAPQEGTAFFEPHGWAEAEYLDLFLESGRLGRDPLSARILRAVFPLLPRKLRAGLERGLGVVRLEPNGWSPLSQTS
jgi:methyltransferase (TIGR00027 family)